MPSTAESMSGRASKMPPPRNGMRCGEEAVEPTRPTAAHPGEVEDQRPPDPLMVRPWPDSRDALATECAETTPKHAVQIRRPVPQPGHREGTYDPESSIRTRT